MTGRAAPLLLLAGLALARPLAAQHFEVDPVRDSATVGDTVTLDVRVHLPEYRQLHDPVPQAAEDWPDGVRLLGADSLRKDGSGYSGRVHLAFYRPGTQPIPPLRVLYRIIGADRPKPVVSEPASIEIVPVVPPGTFPLKDIRDLAPAPDPRPLVAGAAALALAAAAWFRWRRRRAAAPAPVAVAAADPYAEAVERLEAVGRAGWPDRGEVRRHYAAVLAALRDYLVARGATRPSDTAREAAARAAAAAPPARRVFDEAEYVAWARVEPDAPTAASYLRDARSTLDAWHAAPPDAVR